eukprot:8837051-Pyramimonas_sp.AAC.1
MGWTRRSPCTRDRPAWRPSGSAAWPCMPGMGCPGCDLCPFSAGRAAVAPPDADVARVDHGDEAVVHRVAGW